MLHGEATGERAGSCCAVASRGIGILAFFFGIYVTQISYDFQFFQEKSSMIKPVWADSVLVFVLFCVSLRIPLRIMYYCVRCWHSSGGRLALHVRRPPPLIFPPLYRLEVDTLTCTGWGGWQSRTTRQLRSGVDGTG